MTPGICQNTDLGTIESYVFTYIMMMIVTTFICTSEENFKTICWKFLFNTVSPSDLFIDDNFGQLGPRSNQSPSLEF